MQKYGRHAQVGQDGQTKMQSNINVARRTGTTSFISEPLSMGHDEPNKFWLSLGTTWTFAYLCPALEHLSCSGGHPSYPTGPTGFDPGLDQLTSL